MLKFLRDVIDRRLYGRKPLSATSSCILTFSFAKSLPSQTRRDKTLEKKINKLTEMSAVFPGIRLGK